MPDDKKEEQPVDNQEGEESEMEKPHSLSDEEIVRMQTERTLSDAKLVKGGAEYVMNEETKEPRLEITRSQKLDIDAGIDQDIVRWDRLNAHYKRLQKILEAKGIHEGTEITLYYLEDGRRPISMKGTFNGFENGKIKFFPRSDDGLFVTDRLMNIGYIEDIERI